MDEMLDGVADELIKAIEQKDKGMFIDALTALIMHIEAMDEQQDQEEDQD